MRHGGVDRIEQEKSTTFADDGSHAHNTHSAVFAEVKVDEQLGVIRVTRVVSAVAAGRILNTKTARSQIMGGVVWGIGMALHEETLIDHNFGRIMNANIAEYHVPVNADVHDIKVIFVDEPDDIINPLGIKGAGRDRHRRRRGGDRQRGLSRDRQARARPADHARQAAIVRRGRRLISACWRTFPRHDDADGPGRFPQAYAGGGVKPPISAASSRANSIVVGSSPSGPMICRPDRQSLRGQPDRRRGRRQIGQAGEAGKEQLLRIRRRLAVDDDRAFVAIGVAVMREGGGRRDRRQQHVEPLEEFVPGISQLGARLVGVAPGAVSALSRRAPLRRGR